MRAAGYFAVRILLVVLVAACVDPIQFNASSPSFLLVIEGRIDDGPGPYELQLSRSIPVDADSIYRLPVQNAKVVLFDDTGLSDQFVEIAPGSYKTTGAIRAQSGRSYFVKIETADGKLFESEPDPLLPVGEIEEIRYEFEERTSVRPFGEVRADVFNIFIDASAGVNGFVRWRFTGYYEVETYPSLHLTENPPYTPYKNPWPCSGYKLVGGPIGSGGLLERFGDCSCCSCWARQDEDVIQLSDSDLVTNGRFRNIKVGEVPINNATFFKKYLVLVEQMSLSPSTFRTLQLIRTQKTGAASLFQPPSGEIRGNVRAVNNTDPVVGIVWSTSISRKKIFIQPDDLPYKITPIDFITLPCQNFYENASNQPPVDWE